MSWGRCLHPARPDDCRCEGCPLRWEASEATARRSWLTDGEEPPRGEPREAASDRP